MNIVFVSILIVGLGSLMISKPELAFEAMLNGSEKSVELCIKLWAIYAIWLGLLNIVAETGLDKKISKMLSPVVRFLFGKTNEETKKQISINLTSNLLGMGNACTPSGIKGMSGLENKTSRYATTSMIMFMVLNTASLQLIPSTIIGLKITHGSSNPNNIIIPTLIASISAVLSGIVLVKICSKIFKEKK